MGFASVAFDLMLGYPEAIGPKILFLSWTVFSAWFITVGISLYQAPVSRSSEITVEIEAPGPV